MQVLQLSARRKRRNAHKTERDPQHSYAPNLLQRDFTADAPNTKWMSDMTFIETQEGWLYLAGVIDAYSRKIVGWAMGSQHDAELVKHALAMALLQRQPAAGLVHHSYAWNLRKTRLFEPLQGREATVALRRSRGRCRPCVCVESSLCRKRPGFCIDEHSTTPVAFMLQFSPHRRKGLARRHRLSRASRLSEHLRCPTQPHAPRDA
jgi:hypothetical protein